MAKAVLISIRPEWVEKIANGEKTVEVRKTRPKLDTPFKCYIYCTQGNDARRLRGSWGKVIGEFVCDRVTNIFSNSRFWLNEDDVRHTCLTADEIRTYANGAHGLYGWHISDFKLYDKPLPLNTFKKWFRECAYSDLGFAIPDCEKCTDSGCFVQKPPQSW